MLQRILVPTDLSESSVPALELALSMAGPLKVPVAVLYVIVPPRNQLEPSPTPYEVESEEWTRMMRAQAEEAMRRLTPHRPADVTLEYHTVLGNPTEEILLASQSLEAGMIVMATHGRSNFKHLLLGSVAERVIRGAACPVLTVRTGGLVPLMDRHELAEEEVESSLADERTPRRILAAVDLTEGTLSSLQALGQLIDGLDADLTLLYVAEIGYTTLRTLLSAEAALELKMKLERKAGEALEKFLSSHAEQLHPRILRAPRLVAAGEVARELKAAAVQTDAELVVMGRHGRSGFRQWWIGTVAEQAVRTAPCPVMVVP